MSSVNKMNDDNNTKNIENYNKWISSQQEARNAQGTSASAKAAEAMTSLTLYKDTPDPPDFPQDTLFYPGADEYASAMTTTPHEGYRRIAQATQEANLFAPCMVGAVEGQFLKMLTRIRGAKHVLDIGTFTGNSAFAFAEGVGSDGNVVTIEADTKTAAVARSTLEQSDCWDRIDLIEGDARKIVAEMAEKGDTKFDIVFLDADKINYKHYYDAGLQMLTVNGILLADNALCSLVYADDDPVRQSLHEFAQYVRADERVEQVMLTVREGILIVQKKE